MALLSYNSLMALREQDVIDAPIENINGASIDITLAPELLFEVGAGLHSGVHIGAIDPSEKHQLDLVETNLSKRMFNQYVMHPGDFILASSNETFNLPPNIAAEYKLKSSMARIGLQHMLAGWCDPWWENSQLTLELKNVTQFHKILLTNGMKIGQVVFWKCDEFVPKEKGYITKGQYNNQKGATPSKGCK